MPTYTGTQQRFELVETSIKPVVDVSTDEQLLLYQGLASTIQCSLFRDTPDATTFITNINQIQSTQLIVRKSSPNGGILFFQSGTIDNTTTYADWTAETKQQLTFVISDTDTTQQVPPSGELPIYFVITGTTIFNKTYVLGFGYGRIVNLGFVSNPLISNLLLPETPLARGRLVSDLDANGYRILNLDTSNIDFSGTNVIQDHIDLSASPYFADMTGVVDATTLLNTAIQIAAATAKKVFIPGNIKISSTIIHDQSVMIYGTSRATTISWAGPAGGTMLTRTGTIGGGLKDITFDGGLLADNGIILDGCTNGHYEDVGIQNIMAGSHLQLTATASTCSWNTFTRLAVSGHNAAGYSADGVACLYLGGSALNNPCHNSFDTLYISHSGTRHGIKLGNCDNNVFKMTFITRTSGAANGVFVDSSEHISRPSGNVFLHLEAGSGGWYQPDDLTISPAVIFGYQRDNGQPPPTTSGSPLTYLDNAGIRGDFYGVRNIDITGVLSAATVSAQNVFTTDRNVVGVLSTTYDTTARAMFLHQGDTAAIGNIFSTTIPWINAGVVNFQNQVSAVIVTNNGIPLNMVAPTVFHYDISGLNGLQITSPNYDSSVPTYSLGPRIMHSDAVGGDGAGMNIVGTEVKSLRFGYTATGGIDADVAKVSAVNYNTVGSAWGSTTSRFTTGLAFWVSNAGVLTKAGEFTNLGNLLLNTTTLIAPGGAAASVTLPARTGTLAILAGTTTNDSAASGDKGELLTASLAIGSAIALTSGNQVNIVSLTLTAGDWDVTGIVGFDPGATTTVTSYQGGTNTSSLVIDSFDSGRTFALNQASAIPVNDSVFSVCTYRYSLATSTVVYLVGKAVFSGTMGVYGRIRARRIR